MNVDDKYNKIMNEYFNEKVREDISKNIKRGIALSKSKRNIEKINNK